MGREQIQAMKDKIDSLKKDMTDQARALFYEEVKTIFATYPELQSFQWTQYTPYFNDGDTCEFSCNGAHSVDINQRGPNPENDEGFEADDELADIYLGRNRNVGKEAPWSERAANDICGLIDLLGDDVMYDLFGDHSKIIVGREKIVVEDYEHD